MLGHWGDTHGRKNVLVLCMFLMGFSTMLVGVLPTYEHVGIWAPILLVALRLVQGFAVAGEISGASSMVLEHAPFGRRGFFASFTLQGVQAGQILAAAVFLPIATYMGKDDFMAWGWRIPFLLSLVVVIIGYFIRREVDETPAFAEESKDGAVPKAPIIQAFTDELGRHAARRLHGADERDPGRRDHLRRGLRRAARLWRRFQGGRLSLDPRARQHRRRAGHPLVGNLSDKIGRRPPIIFGALCSGLLAFGYLYAISIKNVPMAIGLSILMWGIVYQGYNAVFPSFYPELFQTRYRVSAMAISQNTGTTITALLPALFATVAPPGSTNVPLTVGAIAFAITAIAASPPGRRGKPSGFRSATSAMPTPRRWPSRTTTGCAQPRSAAPRTA